MGEFSQSGLLLDGFIMILDGCGSVVVNAVSRPKVKGREALVD